MGAVALCETKGLGSLQQAELFFHNVLPRMNQFLEERLTEELQHGRKWSKSAFSYQNPAANRMFASPAKLPEYILFKFPAKAEEDVSAHRCCPLRSAQVHELSCSYLLFISSPVTKLSFFSCNWPKNDCSVWHICRHRMEIPDHLSFLPQTLA